jgi:hypothetical protein
MRLALALVAILGLGAASHVVRSDRYRIASAYVDGNTRLPAEQVFAASGLLDRHVLTVRRHVAQRNVEALPDVREARVRVRWPASVSIAVVETQPVLIWDGPAGRMAVDETGRTVHPPRDQEDLPVVHDETGLVSALGQRVPDHVFAAALAYGERLGAAFDDLTYRADVGFVVHKPGAPEIWLGTDALLASQQVAHANAILRHLGDAASDVALVDVRFPSRPYYRQRKGAN